ncbi:hypothetical protein B0H34DRAFT_812022 [Crassisporium funariophilum]|nr:hypothetical protein B0H34DRAFT_812022 [Crassisporium funariophilum]
MSAIPKARGLTTSFNLSKTSEVKAWGLDALIPAAHSAGAPSVESHESTAGITACFTHERVHWVNALRYDPWRIIIDDMAIVPDCFTKDSKILLPTLTMMRILAHGVDSGRLTKYDFDNFITILCKFYDNYSGLTLVSLETDLTQNEEYD